MMGRLRPRSAYDVIALLALVVAVGTGGAYAANSIGSADVIDESLLSQDIKNGEVKGTELAVGAVSSAGILDYSITKVDLGPDSVGTGKIKDGVVANSDLAPNAVTGAKVLDNSLTGADIQESSLGPVPAASTLDGRDSTSFARLGGLIDGDGTVFQGTGFVVSRLSEGEYQVSFPEGALSGGLCPPVVTATVLSGLIRHPQVTGRVCSGLGAGGFTLKTLDSDGVAHDTPFLFIAM